MGEWIGHGQAGIEALRPEDSDHQLRHFSMA